jgi:hypothetical protein
MIVGDINNFQGSIIQQERQQRGIFVLQCLMQHRHFPVITCLHVSSLFHEDICSKHQWYHAQHALFNINTHYDQQSRNILVPDFDGIVDLARQVSRQFYATYDSESNYEQRSNNKKVPAGNGLMNSVS